MAAKLPIGVPIAGMGLGATALIKYEITNCFI